MAKKTKEFARRKGKLIRKISGEENKRAVFKKFIKK